jgi:hypothetical protein
LICIYYLYFIAILQHYFLTGKNASKLQGSQQTTTPTTITTTTATPTKPEETMTTKQSEILNSAEESTASISDSADGKTNY